ncbi:MAG: hypothetical protein O2887_13140 [Bacteroidetes bacterium]|nr:hypothetical protein [Bacteroidota bacterium]MDA1121415.1 hypothetical protein [Bacteroidota bacterium]
MHLFHEMMFFGSFVILLFAILTLVLYKIKYWGQKELRDKYNFASKYEIKYHQTMHILIAVAIGMHLNSLKPELIHDGGIVHEDGFILFFIRLAITIIAGTIYGYIASLILKFYYPTRLSRKLKRLRYTPRINPKTGNKMQLLSEDEEDVYLDEGQRAEEDAFSIDYDVWIDQATGDTTVEKYSGHLTALKCDRCNFMTLKMEREELIKESTEFEEGELIQHYKCTYCNRIKRQSKTIAKIGTSVKVPDRPQFVNPLSDHSVEAVKIEIHGSNGKVKDYQFQNTHEASKLLEEFDFNKVDD